MDEEFKLVLLSFLICLEVVHILNLIPFGDYYSEA
jgi:hypothetical protein